MVLGGGGIFPSGTGEERIAIFNSDGGSFISVAGEGGEGGATMRTGGAIGCCRSGMGPGLGRRADGTLKGEMCRLESGSGSSMGETCVAEGLAWVEDEEEEEDRDQPGIVGSEGKSCISR